MGKRTGLLTRLKEVLVGAPGSPSSFAQRFLQPRLYSKTELLSYFSGYVHAAITPIAEEVAKTEFIINKIDRRTGKETEAVTHPFLSLMRNPNPRMSRFQLMEVSVINFYLLGEFFWYMPKGENMDLPMAIYPLRPDLMAEVINEETGEILGWKYRTGRGEDIPFDLDEILQVKSVNPTNSFRGYSALEAAMKYVLIEKYGSDFTTNFLANNAFPGGILTVKQKMSDPAWAKFKTQFSSLYQGIDKAGQVMAFQGADVEFEKIGSNLAEVALKDLKELSSEAILNMFRVPKQILGIPDNINLATSQVLERTFAKRTVEPMIYRIEDGLQDLMDAYSRSLNKGRMNKVDFEITHESVIPEDLDAKLKEYQAGLNNWLTINEVREYQGLEPVVGGDVMYQASGLVPVGTTMTPQQQVANPKAQVKRVKNVRFVVKEKERSLVSLQEFEQYRSEKWSSILDYEKKTLDILEKYLDRQEKQVLQRLKPKAFRAKAFEDIIFDPAAEATVFATVFIPLLTELASKQADIAGTLVGAEGVLVDPVSTYIRERVALLGENFNNQTKAKLEKVLTEATKNGDTVAHTAKEISSVYDKARGYRSDAISRTELNGIANFQAQESYKEAGVRYLVWFANNGACEFCSATDGKIVGISSAFAELGQTITGKNGGSYKIDYQGVGHPPLHPNCKCDIVPQNDYKTPFGGLPPLDSREVYGEV